jgi:hypothetical protein
VLAIGPDRVPDRHRPRYAALIADAGRSTDREVRRTAMDAVPLWARWLPGGASLIEDGLADLGDRLGSIEAAPLLGALRRVRGDFGRVLLGLADRDAADDRPDDTLADRPARRRIRVLLDGAVASARGPVGAGARAALIEAVRRLAERPVFTGVGAGALVGLGRLDNLDEIADLCTGRPGLAVRVAERVGPRIRELPELPELLDAGRLYGVVRRLAGRGDLAGGLFAVALVRPGVSFEWAAPWRDLLVGPGPIRTPTCARRRTPST